MIALENVHKHYDTGGAPVYALRGIDLEVARGECVAVMGPSGSGKTTLLEILGCLSTPTTGRYRLDGLPADSFDDDALARLRGERIGFVFQSFHLLSRLDLIENVELPLTYRGTGRRERRDRALRALERVGLLHRASHRPSEISGGEQQRVAIARALVNEPSIVLADEPTGNLDTASGLEILALLDRIHAAGATVVIVTHDPQIGARAARRLFLRDGVIERDERN